MATRVSVSIISRTSWPRVAEPLGDPGGDERGAQPHERRARRRWRRRRPSGPGPRAEVVLEELAHLAATLADQGDAPRSAASVPRAIIDSRVDLPTPEPAKMPTRWPRPTGTRVSRARTPRPSWVSMRGAAQRVRGRARRHRTGRRARSERAAVDRAAEAVEDPAEQAGADRHRAAGRRWPRPGARPHAAQVPRACSVAGVAVQRDHLGEHRPGVALEARAARRRRGRARRRPR